MNFLRQTTFCCPFSVVGVGLHSGIECRVNLQPAPLESGIRVQIEGGPLVQIEDLRVIKTSRCTRFSDVEGNIVDTPEHLLAALVLAGIDNCIIQFKSPEVPILDGCAVAWLQHFSKAGIFTSSVPARHFEVVGSFRFTEGDSSYVVVPGATRVVVDIDFSHPVIGRQTVDVLGRQFPTLASSRTFVLAQDINKLQAAGLALGGSLDNAVVVGDTDVLNPGGFRFDNECARHKALDLIGDMYVLGRPVFASIYASRPSHSANASFVAALKASGLIRLNGPAMSAAA